MRIESSELIINSDNSVFHLHLKPEQLADNVILVGDPSRVEMVASFFGKCEAKNASREFHSVTGYYKGVRFTVLSTGIGSDNIDIVMNELDALANIDFKTREIKDGKRSLRILRLGTCGALQPDIRLGTPVFSLVSIGFDGLLNWYAGRESITMADAEAAFLKHIEWERHLQIPYFVKADEGLASLFENDALAGMTISAAGFYAPQGRVLRLGLAMPDLLDKCESFRYEGYRIANFEMEGAALAGFARLMGHRAATLCCTIANRHNHDALPDYKTKVREMVEMALDRLVEEQQGGK